MRGKKLILLLLPLLQVFSASANIQKFPVNRADNEPYENRATVSIEFMKEADTLININGIVNLIQKDFYSIADQLVLVARYNGDSTSSLILVNNRLNNIKTALIQAGFLPERINFILEQSAAPSEYIDVYIIPHSWKGLASSVIKDMIEKEQGTIIARDTKEGLSITAIGSVLIKDGDATQSLTEFTQNIGWSTFKSTGMENVSFSSPITLNFPGYIKPFKPEQAIELIEKIKLSQQALADFGYEVYPEEKLIYVFKNSEVQSD